MTAGRGVTIALALVSAAMWGLWWAPVRALEARGLDGLWAGFAMSLAALPALALASRGAWRAPPRAMAGAALVGVAVTLYGAALAFTEVSRAVLLFYLAPAWSVAIECAFLGRRWGPRSAWALGLSFLGIATIFRFEIDASGWNGGDLAALVSGMAWAVGAALVFAAPPAGTDARAWGPLALICGAGAALFGAAALIVGGPAAGAAPEWRALAAAPAALAGGALYLAPILLITMAAALQLPPATMSFILTAEIIAGVGSSAVLLDERFGAPEALGATLVALGALVETTTPVAARRT
jgi:drug/metabolite transporter (DMT)-like permease